LLFQAYTDGSSRAGNPGRAAWAYIIKSDVDGEIIRQDAACLPLIATNNRAEYQAAIECMKWWCANSFRYNYAILTLNSDSQLVVNQLIGTYQVKNPDLRPIWAEAFHLMGLTRTQVKWVPREKNSETDALVNVVQDAKERLLGIR
jgi:ribonuclease HI